jgi:hypothetical protein
MGHGCQMVYFQTKNPNLTFGGPSLGMENVDILYGHSEYITAIWYLFKPFGNFVAIWYIFPHFGILCQEKSGNPGTGSGTDLHNLSLTDAPSLLSRVSFHHVQVGQTVAVQSGIDFQNPIWNRCYDLKKFQQQNGVKIGVFDSK